MNNHYDRVTFDHGLDGLDVIEAFVNGRRVRVQPKRLTVSLYPERPLRDDGAFVTVEGQQVTVGGERGKQWRTIQFRDEPKSYEHGVGRISDLPAVVREQIAADLATIGGEEE